MKILIVDDNKDLDDSLQFNLRASDPSLEVGTALDGKQALSWIEVNGKPDVIILDIVMPEMNGWAFLAELDARHIPPIPVIVWSDFVDEHVGPKTRITATISKMAKVSQIINLIRKILGKPLLEIHNPI